VPDAERETTGSRRPVVEVNRGGQGIVFCARRLGDQAAFHANTPARRHNRVTLKQEPVSSPSLAAQLWPLTGLQRRYFCPALHGKMLSTRCSLWRGGGLDATGREKIQKIRASKFSSG
jgi:hypothetical protein